MLNSPWKTDFVPYLAWAEELVNTYLLRNNYTNINPIQSFQQKFTVTLKLVTCGINSLSSKPTKDNSTGIRNKIFVIL